jgi:hypothetical protein
VDAIEAAVQVRSAKGTNLPPAHRSLDFQTLQTCMASFHLFFTGKIFCTTYFLFSRHSIKASTAGTIHPKMLNQIGIFTPFATMSTWRISLSKWAMEIAIRRIATMVVTGFMIGPPFEFK